MRILQPSNSFIRSCFYSGKYKDAVVKVQLIVDFLGRIVYFSGPHIGTKYDGHIYQDTYDEHTVCNQEYLLGDGHYGIIPHIITTTSYPANGHISDLEYIQNTLISHYRSRVEHINRLVESHGLFKQHFRGGLEILSSAIRVTLQFTNIECCRYLRYRPVGPWKHFP